MMTEWLGLSNRRDAWVFALSLVAVAALLVLAEPASLDLRVNLLLIASMTAYMGLTS